MVATVVPVTLYLVVVRRCDTPGMTLSASDEAGYRILLCTSWATVGTGSQLFRMGFDGTDKHRLSTEDLCEGTWVDPVQAVFGVAPHGSPDARLIRLDPNPSNPIAEWTVSEVEAARGLRNPRITRNRPAVGADGVMVFTAEGADGNRDIYALDPVAETLLRLTRSDAVDDWPTVSENGTRVDFTSFRTGNGDLYSVELTGGELTRLTHHSLQDAGAWVRGDSVVFVRGRGVEAEDGNMELMLLELDTGSETALTDNAWNDYEHAWSPDGRSLCWQSERLGHYESDIMVMDLAAGRTWNATQAPGRESDCRWTPVGAGLLFLRFDDPGGIDIYAQSTSGGDPVNLTRYPGSEAVVGIFPLPKALLQATRNRP